MATDDRSGAPASQPWISAANAALWMLNEAIVEHDPSHVFGMFSGGHDSLTATAIAAKHPRFTAAVHINTGVGIAETREFVRETCDRQGWPLIELHPDGKSYRDLVTEKGMPAGPKAHNTMFYWLKQRQIRRLVSEHKQSRHDRIGLVTGIRASESQRRMAAALAVPVRRQGAQLWLNPILEWSATDCSRFMEAQGLKRNPVVDLLHRSGECLCGALAHHSEMAEIEAWFPAAAAELHGYEELAREQGAPGRHLGEQAARAAFSAEAAVVLVVRGGRMSSAATSLPVIAPRHDWKLAPKSLFSTYLCRACGMASMVKHYGRCSGGR